MPANRRSGAGRDAKLIDSFALAQIARSEDLSSTEQHLLGWLCLLADRRIGKYHGTYAKLHDDSRINLVTLPKTLARLIDLGLVEVLRPFERGQMGTVLILCYANVVVTPPSYEGRAPLYNGSETALKDIRDDFASDQHFRGKLRNMASTEEEGRESRETVDGEQDESLFDLCSVCNGPADGGKSARDGLLYCVDCTPT